MAFSPETIDEIANSRELVINYMRIRTRDPDRAEDMAHDALLRALQSSANNGRPPEQAIPSYLCAIAMNVFKDEIRRSKVRSNFAFLVASSDRCFDGESTVIATEQLGKIRRSKMIRTFEDMHNLGILLPARVSLKQGFRAIRKFQRDQRLEITQQSKNSSMQKSGDLEVHLL